MSDRTCSIDNCVRPAKSRGWCGTHYERWRKHGTTDDTWTPDPVCEVDGCDRPTKARGWCKIHWQRWKRCGDVQPDLPIAEPFTYVGVACDVVDCNRPAASRGWCKAHHYRRTRWGDPIGGSEPLPQVSRADDWTPRYSAAHWRVNSRRGPASDLTCVDCDGQAAHWSYDNQDPAELVENDGPATGLRYSLDVEHYHPRCVPCHKHFDSAQSAA